MKLLKNIGIHSSEVDISHILWSHISAISLDDEFIHEFHDKLDWIMISKVHTLSNELIFKYKHLIEWNYYFDRNKVEFWMMKKFILKTTFRYLYEFQNIHLSDIQKKGIQRLLDVKHMFKK